ncbi:hypothetical protein RRG08_062142 [Elysia crispata]|uniref:Uncharacterized protein n=1 Tax=Elysia crispata TaxID=231223 RepID=A0AAE1D298_9GAST|nr:hypothetical protein RRG08_062142 [Elysia crispata]
MPSCKTLITNSAEFRLSRGLVNINTITYATGVITVGPLGIFYRRNIIEAGYDVALFFSGPGLSLDHSYQWVTSADLCRNVFFKCLLAKTDPN